MHSKAAKRYITLTNGPTRRFCTDLNLIIMVNNKQQQKKRETKMRNYGTLNKGCIYSDDDT